MKHFAALCLSLLLVVPLPAAAQYAMDLSNLVRAIRLADVGRDLENLDRAQSVYVTRVSRLAGIRLQGALLDRALGARQRTRHVIQSVVGGSRVAMKALAAHGEALEDVIFLTTTNDGTAMLYVDDR
ncbi:MAG: hypothetical protein EOP19_03630 [Hyphomicrobiales bacterium]|nr:MAG: hypothetical protein EOP19_03630 [Hyphomicrobiales bacterium]